MMSSRTIVGSTAVRSWRLRSGLEYCRPELAVEGHRELAVEVRGNTAILHARLRSGGEHVPSGAGGSCIRSKWPGTLPGVLAVEAGWRARRSAADLRSPDR